MSDTSETSRALSLDALREALMTYLVALAASLCTRNGILLKT
ncbi:MAG TPA: hypothetical protein VLT13_00145 [Bacteroidota bacterium]|nr:hypothetical protein [Bacteroidota bacterium]